jgi:hypothetical protein
MVRPDDWDAIMRQTARSFSFAISTVVVGIVVAALALTLSGSASAGLAYVGIAVEDSEFQNGGTVVPGIAAIAFGAYTNSPTDFSSITVSCSGSGCPQTIPTSSPFLNGDGHLWECR